MRKIFASVIALSLLSNECKSLSLDKADVRFVTDLAIVSGCHFLGTVRPPTATLGSRQQADYERYRAALIDDAARRGATHLYVLNNAAGWGGAAAFGTAYRCRR